MVRLQGTRVGTSHTALTPFGAFSKANGVGDDTTIEF
jgi:hypothetical protein